MERDELESFLILAEELHFGRTAARMRLSRARVSQLIQRLERRLGAPLFERTSRRVDLTELGGRLRDDLEPHHRAIEDIFARAVAAERGFEGAVLIGFSDSLTGEIAMRAGEALRKAHPEASVEICEMPFNDPFGGLRDRYYDAQIMELPVREDDLSKGPTLLTEERVLAVAAGHPLAVRESMSMEELAETPLLRLEGDLPDYLAERRSPTHTLGGRPIEAGPAVTSLQEALMLVAGGKGALLVGAHTAVHQPRPGIAYVPLVDAAPARYGMVWRTGEDSRVVKALAANAAEAAAAMQMSPKPIPQNPRLGMSSGRIRVGA